MRAEAPFVDALPTPRPRLASFVALALVGLLSAPAVAQTNVAQGKPATQSSTCFNGIASRAVDGSSYGGFSGGSVTHTCLQARPSWQVDLGAEFLITSIVVHNRTDCCSTRLSNFDVTVLDAANQATWSGYQGAFPNPAITLSVPSVKGRTVRVQLRASSDYLSLAEVKVLGHPTSVPSGYMGCFTDDANRALPSNQGASHNLSSCADRCRSLAFAFAGAQSSEQCFCGNTLGYQLVSDTQCNTPCRLGAGTCGGAWRNSIYWTGLPSSPKLVSPTGTTPEATPVLVWNAAQGATEYLLKIDDIEDPGNTVNVYKLFVDAGSACPSSPCTWATGKGLQEHPYKWSVQARNSAGATWSGSLNFTVTLPSAPLPLQPSGPTPSQPTYRWQPVAGATSYLLSVEGESPEVRTVLHQRYTASSVCAQGQCAVTQPASLLDGGYTWRVRGGNAAGDGPFSSPMRFVTPTWAGGTGCSGVYLAADFNADGRTDRLCSRQNVTNVSLSTGEGFTTPTVWLDGQLYSPMVADFNGDGAADLAQYDGGTKVFQVALATGTVFVPFTPWGTATAVWTDGQTYSCGGGTGSAKRGTGNFDGNGYADVFCRGALSGRTFVGKSTGSSFTFSIFADYMCGTGGEGIGPADFDGDGRDDWYCIDGYGGLYGRLSNGQAFEDQTFQGPGRGYCAGEDWSFVDINTDGRTDAVCRTNGRVLLSTGAAMVDTGSTGNWCNFWQEIQNPEDPQNPTWVLRSQMQPMDTDGDRQPELVCTFAGQYYRDVHVRKWTGQALGPSQILAESWCGTSVRGGDFDGDGKFELVCDNGSVLRAGTPNVVPDLMTEASNGLGGRSTASYGPSSAFGCNKPPVRQVVTSTSVDDGRGGTSTTSYRYCDGRTDPTEGAFLGYGQVQATLPRLSGENAGPVTTTVYSQELRSLGRPTLVGQADGAGKVLRETRTFFHPQSGPALPRRALVSEVRTTDFAPSGGASKTTSVTYTYDAYANVKEQLARGEVTMAGTEIPNDELRTNTTYWPADTARYLVSRPYTRQMSEQRGQGWTLLKSIETTYEASDLKKVKTYVLPGSTSVERTMDYDSAGNLIYVRSELGAETTIVPTGDGLHPHTVTNREGTVTTSWDPLCDLPSQVTDPNGTTTTTYDELCRPERIDGPIEGAFSERFYLSLGNPSAQHIRIEGPSSAPADGNDYAEDYFDGLGRTYRSVRRGPPSDGDIVTERTYNARGAVATVTAPFYEGDAPETTTTTYDHFDRVESILPPDGNAITKSYDLWTVTTTDPKQKATTVESGTKSTIERTVVETEPVTTVTDFDMLGRRTKLTDTEGNVWTWTYDSLDRVWSQVDPDSGPRTIVYDDAARTRAETDARGLTLTVTYDDFGRIESKASADGTATFRYGERHGPHRNWGRLTTVVSPDPEGAPSTLEIDHDAAGEVRRQWREIPSAGYSGEVLREYDVAGRMTRLTYPGGPFIGPFAYDGAGRLTSIPGILDNVTYDAAGRPLVQTNANHTTTTRTYHAGRGLLDTLVTAAPGGATVQNLRYGYDRELPLVTSVQRPILSDSRTYDYDDGYRLTSVSIPSHPPQVVEQSWTYDVLGRITSNSRVGVYDYPEPGQPRPHAPKYVAGQLYQYDAAGNLLQGGLRAPSWDAESRIRAVGTTRFTYDTFGERLRKISPSGTSLYPFGDDYEITNGVTTRYVSVDGLGVIAKVVTGGTAPPETFWVHTDRLGNIEAVTGESGAIKLNRTYRAYGETLSESGAHPESRGWIDQRNDGETGLTYLHARYFDPKLGIFLSPDPIGVAGGMNQYGYALGDPVNGTDRTGLVKDECEDIEGCRRTTFSPMMSLGMGEFLSVIAGPSGGILSPTLTAAVAEHEQRLIAEGHGGVHTYTGADGHTYVTMDPIAIATDPCLNPAACAPENNPTRFTHLDSGLVLEVRPPPSWADRGLRGPQLAQNGLKDTEEQLRSQGYSEEFIRQLLSKGYVEDRPLEAPSLILDPTLLAGAGVTVTLRSVSTFATFGSEWHFGLEWASTHENIVHLGRHAVFGVHAAFGAVAPYAAKYHFYFQSTFPFVRFWQP